VMPEWYYIKHKNKYIGRVLSVSIMDAMLFFFKREKIKGYWVDSEGYYVIVLHEEIK